MARRTRNMETWITEVLADKEKGECCAITLVHVHGVGTQKEIYSKKVAPQMNLKDLVELFYNKADDYAQAAPGTNQTFALLAFYEGKTEPEGYYPFIRSVSLEGAGYIGATEPPTPQGEKQQSMRHLESQMQLVMRQSMALFDAQNRFMQIMSETQARLMQENADAYQVVRDVMMQKITDDRKFLTEMQDKSQKAKERQMLLQYLPLLVNTLTGKEVFPQSNADTLLIEGIAENIDEKAIAKLLEADIIPPKLMGPLMDRVSKIMEKKEKEKQAIKELPKASPEAELE